MQCTGQVVIKGKLLYEAKKLFIDCDVYPLYQSIFVQLFSLGGRAFVIKEQTGYTELKAFVIHCQQTKAAKIILLFFCVRIINSLFVISKMVSVKRTSFMLMASLVFLFERRIIRVFSNLVCFSRT